MTKSAVVVMLDGRRIPAEPETLRHLTPGVGVTRGMFETLRTVDGHPLFLQDHLIRMNRGLRLIGLKNPQTDRRWIESINEICGRMSQDARVRCMVFSDGRRTHCAVVVEPIAPLQGGYHVSVSSLRRPLTRLSHVKSADYAVFVRAFEEARQRGCDEAILLNARDEVVEASRSNVFWISENVLQTPAVDCGCLNGITRSKIIGLARGLSVPVRYVRAPLDDALKAEAVFLTNSVAGPVPVSSIDSRAFSVDHPLMLQLRLYYWKMARRT